MSDTTAPAARSTCYVRGHIDRAAQKDNTPLRFVVATEGAKGDGLNLKMDGARLERYLSNPVVLWAHDYWSAPIGLGSNVEVDGDRLLADVEFDRGDDFAREVERKYREGFLNAVSIGFDPITVVDPNSGKSQSWWMGGDVTEWEMWEFSAVPVPMDPKALVESGRMARAALDALGISAEQARLLNLDPTRAGAVLSARNKERLTQARDLIAEVLSSATKDDEETDDTEQAADESTDRTIAEAAAALREFRSNVDRSDTAERLAELRDLLAV